MGLGVVTRVLVLGLVIGIPRTEYLGQQTATPGAALPESLSEEVNDPTATLTQAQLKEDFTPSEFATDAQPNMTIPQNKGTSTRTEFGDTQLLDHFVMPRSLTEGIDFRWAVGPYFVFPTATSRSAARGAWQAGPAAAFRYRPIAALLISGLMQQAISFADTSPQRTPVSRLAFQPMLSYQLGAGWYVRSSDATWTFNLRRGTTIALSGGLGKVRKLGDGVAINDSIVGEWMV
jgi:hypothetical protein